MSRQARQNANHPSDSSEFPIDLNIWQQVLKKLALPPQQRAIVEHILLNRQDKQIAKEMGISVPTVRTYISRIFARTQTDDRQTLTVMLFRTAMEIAKEAQGGH